MQKVASNERVHRSELPREMPLEKLYPPLVYFPNPQYSSSLSGLIGPERRAFEKLLPELERNGVMSESEIAAFIKNELPMTAESRIGALLWSITRDGGLTRKKVIVEEEELGGYYRGLLKYRMREWKRGNTISLRRHGVDRKFLHLLDRYDMAMIEPFMENPKGTNNLFCGWSKELKKLKVPEKLVLPCIRIGIDSEDAKILITDNGVFLKQAIRYDAEWRGKAGEIIEVAERYNFDLKKHKGALFYPKSNFESNLRLCHKLGKNPEEAGLVGKLDWSPETFKKDFMLRGKIEVVVDRAKSDEMQTVIDIYTKHKGDCDNVGCSNTYVAQSPSGIVIGALSFFEIHPKTVVIRTAGVDPDCERMGVGRQLFEHTIKKFKEKGFNSIVVAHQNRNQEFFENLGFKELNPSEMVLELRG